MPVGWGHYFPFGVGEQLAVQQVEDVAKLLAMLGEFTFIVFARPIHRRRGRFQFIGSQRPRRDANRTEWFGAGRPRGDSCKKCRGLGGFSRRGRLAGSVKQYAESATSGRKGGHCFGPSRAEVIILRPSTVAGADDDDDDLMIQSKKVVESGQLEPPRTTASAATLPPGASHRS